LERRKAIPLDENEGIYVKDIQTGEVKAVSGQSYMLGANEVLWNKYFPEEIERLLANSRSGIPYIPPKIDEKGNLSYAFAPDTNYKRDPTRIVTYKAAHNAACQIYDYKNK
jgi:major vault protein